jgi:pimeloyl-ACP methyl ester carboxylesterase
MQPSWTVTSADGVEIAAYEHGGSGDPIVIAHATGFCGPMYNELALNLIDAHRVVSLDFRGHGNSARPADDDFSWAKMADDLQAVIDRIDSPVIHGVGHSMGGATLVLTELAHPGQYTSLFLFEPIIVPVGLLGTGSNGPNVMASTARARRASFDTRAEALYRYAGRPPLGLMRASILATYVNDGFADGDDGRVHLKCRPDDEARTFEANDAVRFDMVRGVTTPTVVAAGHDEPGTNPGRFAPFIADALPNGVLQPYPHLGHFGPFQDPDAVAADIRAHIAHVTASVSGQ